jgi:flagellar biogenesis protein FliO
MKVIEKMQLTQKSSLLLVSCDGRELLLSVGPDQARVLQSQLSSSREFFEETFADMYSSEDEEKRCVA